MTTTMVREPSPASRLALSLVMIVAAGCWLRFFDLTGQSLWYDEGVSLIFSEGASISEVVDKLGSTQTSERYQPLYFLLLYLWRQAFGSSEWTLKAFSALLGSLALIAFVFVARRFLEATGRLAAVGFMAASSFAVYYSQEVRPYSLVLLCCVLHWLLIGNIFDSNARSERRRLTAQAALISVIGGFTSLFFTLHVASAGAAWLAVGRQRGQQWFFWAASTLALVPSLLFFALAGPNGSENTAIVSRTDHSLLANAVFSLYGLLVGVTYGPPVTALREGNWMELLQRHWIGLAILVAVCVAIVAAAAAEVRHRSRNEAGSGNQARRYPDAYLIGGFVLLFGLAYATRLNWLPRHSTFLLPAIALGLGHLCDPKRTLGYRSFQARLGTAAVVALVFMNMISLGHYFVDDTHRRDDYRAVARFLGFQQPTPVVLLLGSPHLLDYYRAPPLVDVRWSRDPEKVRRIEEYLGGARRFLVVINREDLLPGGLQAVQELLESTAALTEVYEFPAFKIAEFTVERGQLGN